MKNISCETISVATDENFDANGYLDYNTDIKQTLTQEEAYKHFKLHGFKESRKQFNLSAVYEMRKKKMNNFKNVFNLNKAHEIMNDGKYNFLNDALKEKFKVVDTTNISAHSYDYDGYELMDDIKILDCGAGFRNIYYKNVINFEIVNYASTDVIGVCEDLPFRDNSFDVIYSMAVLEHVVDPKKCASEMFRVLKSSGKIVCDAPFMVPYHGYPNHYFNFTPSGARLLFENEPNVKIEEQFVPQHFHPIFTLSWILSEWAKGLPENVRGDFLDMNVRDLMLRELHKNLGKEFCKQLDRDKAETVAAGTRLVITKVG